MSTKFNFHKSTSWKFQLQSLRSIQCLGHQLSALCAVHPVPCSEVNQLTSVGMLPPLASRGSQRAMEPPTSTQTSWTLAPASWTSVNVSCWRSNKNIKNPGDLWLFDVIWVMKFFWFTNESPKFEIHLIINYQLITENLVGLPIKYLFN